MKWSWRIIAALVVAVAGLTGCQGAKPYGKEAQVYLPGDHRLVWAVAPAVNVSGQDVDPLLQADDLYELITERAGKSLVLTSNRAPADWYPLFPNPVVAESLLDRLINNSHQVFMNGPSYRPNKRPGCVLPTGNASGN